LTLDYRGNAMVDIDELIHLKDIQSLQLEGNPCYGLEKEKALAEEAAALASAGGVRDPHAPPPDGLTEDEFRLHVVARLQSLVSLDGQVRGCLNQFFSCACFVASRMSISFSGRCHHKLIERNCAYKIWSDSFLIYLHRLDNNPGGNC